MTYKVIAFANQKGGVGKTTSCINLAAALVTLKQQVLVVDLDPQGNATMGSGIDKNRLPHSVNELLQGQVPIQDVLIPMSAGGYALLPANADLTAAEVALLRKPHQERRLREALQAVRKHYAFILIDCPPSLNMLTLNGLVAADAVIIPMQCEYYALEGLSALLQTIEQIKQGLNPSLEVQGIIRTMYDARNKLSLEVGSQLLSHFGKRVYKTVVPRNVRLAEAPSHGVPISLYDKQSRGAQAYLALAKEIMRQVQEGSDRSAVLV